MGTTRRKAAVFTLLAVALIATLLALSGCLGTESNKYTIKYFASAGGELVGNQWQTVNEGGNATMVTAVPKEGFMFDKWSDGQMSAERTDTGIKADMEAIAEFKTAVLSVSYIATDRGEIIGEATQQVEYGGAATAVTAVAKDGFRFGGWSDGVTTAERQDSEIIKNFAVSAVFNKDIRYTISYKIANRYGEILGNIEQFIYDGEDAESVKAIPNIGAKFIGWSDGVMTQERQDKNIRANISLIARFEPLMYNTIYTATEGGIVVTSDGNQSVYPNTTVTATAKPEEAYEFVKWSDGVLTAVRKDIITADLEVRAIFKRKELVVKYTPQKGGGISGQQEQFVLYGSATSAVTAKADAGYEFLSWSDGIMTPTRQDSEVKNNVDVRATFAPINGVEYRVLMVHATELHTELLSNDDEIIKVDYVMSQVEREILKVVTRKLAACLNDIFEGEVRFVLDNYFTTQPLGKENLNRGMSLGRYAYGIMSKDVPEIRHMLSIYGSTMITFSMNDFDNKLHIPGGAGGAKDAFLHFENLLWSSINNGTPIENLLDFRMLNTQLCWEQNIPSYMHEFIHTVEKQVQLNYNLHTAIEYYGGYGNDYGMGVMKLYIQGSAFVNDEYIGVTEIFWKEWHNSNPRINI